VVYLPGWKISLCDCPYRRDLQKSKLNPINWLSTFGR
jgi:hypothetical protein